jgi:hypothetical protein
MIGVHKLLDCDVLNIDLTLSLTNTEFHRGNYGFILRL